MFGDAPSDYMTDEEKQAQRQQWAVRDANAAAERRRQPEGQWAAVVLTKHSDWLSAADSVHAVALVPLARAAAAAQEIRDAAGKVGSAEDTDWNYDDLSAAVQGLGYPVLARCVLDEDDVRAHAVGPVGVRHCPIEFRGLPEPEPDPRRVYQPGDAVTLVIYNHPDHRHGVVEAVVTTREGVHYQVRRQDGRLVHTEATELAPRFDSAGAATGRTGGDQPDPAN